MLVRLLFLPLLLHAYLAWRLVPPLPGPAALALGAYLVFSCGAIPLGLMHRHVARPPQADRLAWLGFAAMGVFSSLLAFTLMRDALLLAASWFTAVGPWLAPSALAVLALTAAVSLYGFWRARRVPPVRRVKLHIPGLAAGLVGLRILQITDLHVGPTIRRPFVQAMVQRANALQADVVALTGDLVDGPVDELREHTAPLAALRARLGVYLVTGNHEYYAGCTPWLQEYRRLGLQVLLNEHRLLTTGHPGAQLLLAGVTDWSAHHFDVSHRSDPQAALHGASESVDLRLLLAHQPRSAAAAEQAGFDVQLSGHTHGGQLWPWAYLVYLQQPYRAGLARRGRLQVYVSRGSGYWGPPMRLGAPSELSLITLVAA